VADDWVADEERLYRSVRSSEILRDASGQALRASSQAFADRHQQVSVNRASWCDHDPRSTQKSRSDAVVELIAGEVRAIRSLLRRDDQGREVGLYAIDVSPDPLPDNTAHAVIYAHPQFASRSLFKRLQEQLAYMARLVLLPDDEANNA
jgi:hypothetical protein